MLRNIGRFAERATALKSSRQWLLLGLALTFGNVAAVQPANASAFFWISAPNWTYSAAAAACPAGIAKFWGLSVGANSFSYAYAYCHHPLGSSAAYAVAAAGRGGAGAAVAVGFADPWANMDIGIPLEGGATTPQSFSGIGSDTYSSFTDDYDVFNDHISFTSSGDAEFGSPALTHIAAYEYTGSNALDDLCALFGASAGCGSPGANSVGDVTDFSTFETDFGSNLVSLGSLTDPDLSQPLNFNQTVSNLSNIILVGEGDAAAVPEPNSILLFGAGLLAFVMAGGRSRGLFHRKRFRAMGS